MIFRCKQVSWYSRRNGVQQAERAVSKANPPNPGGKGIANKSCVTPGNATEADIAVSKENLRRICQAHDPLDDEFQEIMEQAGEEEVPLTRKALADVGKQKRRKQVRKERDTKLSAQETLFPTMPRLNCSPASDGRAGRLWETRLITYKPMFVLCILFFGNTEKSGIPAYIFTIFCHKKRI